MKSDESKLLFLTFSPLWHCFFEFLLFILSNSINIQTPLQGTSIVDHLLSFSLDKSSISTLFSIQLLFDLLSNV